ncbi:hypothetical protein [Okeania sp. SIO2B3]|uniref:hypothetical protein n=1 Tax=Okeania sp. SIO2B3 TaxID=2607784 RepID=UPI0013BEEE1F|nr:hypothetical protein [Okeania sp. SIO2B3]NET40972.1 hypothetical protein [Okeania sp. SIO2B3]
MEVFWYEVGVNPPLISCPVEYLHFGGRKAGGRRQEAEGKKRRLREKVFFHH